MKPFAGNVTGQGPGFAELPLKDNWRVGLLAADKAGPAAFNVPVFQAADKALAREAFRSRYGESVALCPLGAKRDPGSLPADHIRGRVTRLQAGGGG